MLTLLQHEISRVLRSGRCFALVLAGVGAVAVGLGLAWADELGSIFLALALLVSSALLASAGGMAAGLMLRRTVPALMTAEAITAGPWILAPIFLSIYVPGSGLSSWISPFAATASLFEGAADQRNSLAPAGCAVLHLAAGLALLAWLRRKLGRGE